MTMHRMESIFPGFGMWILTFRRRVFNSITVSGIRCQDMRLRMKYVDIPSMLEADVEKAIRKAGVEDGTGNLYVLVNYTPHCLVPEIY